MKKRHTGLVVLLAALFVAEAAALCLVYSGFWRLPGSAGRYSPAAVQPQSDLLIPSPSAEATPVPTPEVTPEPVVTTVTLKNDCLPDNYQLTAYTACTNTNAYAQSYIDTGVYPTMHTSAILDFECTSGFVRKDTWFFGAFDRPNDMFLEAGFHQGQGNDCHFYTACGMEYSQYEDPAARTVATYRAGAYPFTEPVSRSLYIFSRQHTDGGIAGTTDTWGDYSLRVYNLRLAEDNVPTRDYVPCIRLSDGAAGMYDLVERKMYFSAGTGSFECGDSVLPPTTVMAVNGRIESQLPVPQLDGFAFDGYWTGYGGEGRQCVLPDGTPCADCGLDSELVLYAHWVRV